MSLFNNRFAPTTSQLGFVEAPLELFSAAHCKWHNELARPLGGTVERTSLNEPLESMLRRLDPLVTIYPTRYLFVSTASPWVAFFDNGVNGADPMTLSYLAKK